MPIDPASVCPRDYHLAAGVAVDDVRIIRTWMPRQAAEADKLFREMYGTTLEERFTPDKYQLMHIEMFSHHIIHAEGVGDVDLLGSAAAFAVCNRRATVGFSRSAWRFVDGESLIGRCVAFVDDAEYEELMARKAALPKTRLLASSSSFCICTRAITLARLGPCANWPTRTTK